MKRGNKRGLSTIVATLLIILLTIVAVSIVWIVVKSTLDKNSEQISLGKFTIGMEISSIQQTPNGLEVTVQRDSGEGELYGISFLIFDGKETHTYEFKNITFNPLEKRTFTINYTGNITTISIYPLVETSSGKILTGEISDIYTPTGNEIVPLNCIANCTGKACGSDGCGNQCSPGCLSGYNCNSSWLCEKIILPTENLKDINLYSDKEIFLISDGNWREVLPLVSLTTWTKGIEDNSICQEGYGTAEDTCVYSTLIFHEESGTLLTDLTQGAIIEASSSYMSYIANNLIDDSFLTNWNSGSTSLGEIKINLTETKQINRIDTFEDAEPYFITISVSTDNITYQEVAINYPLIKPEGYEVVRNQIEFTPVNARYIKIIFSDNPAQKTYPNWKTATEIKIYGQEGNPYTSFDSDSIIYFMQQYSPTKVTIIEDTPIELDNLLTASGIGAGLNPSQIQRINADDYLSYWESYNDILYVEEDYELALVASTYASLLNAPLIIEGSSLDINSNFQDKNVICIGNTGRTCNEEYTLNELQEKYIEETETNKIILINPNDLNIKVEEEFQPYRSTNKFYELYGKNSLASPFLASAKQEIILTTTSTSFQTIDNLINDTVHDLMPDIINNSLGILDKNPNWGETYYYIYGFLTIFGANNSIVYKNYSTIYSGYQMDIALDQNRYGDIFLEDRLPDLAVGRIQGITTSDVSSYISRSLFYNNLIKTNNMQFMAKTISSMLLHAYQWTVIFEKVGYTSNCNILNDAGYLPPEKCTIDPDISNWELLWDNNELIVFMDHGGAYSAGIQSSEIPLLTNSIVIADACLTCSTYDSRSFCNNAIRNGAIAAMGAVSYATAGDRTWKYTIEGIYFENLTLGQSFSKAYNYYFPYYMNTFLGDPTLDLNPEHTLSKELTWYSFEEV